jgi:hypothetical protein
MEWITFVGVQRRDFLSSVSQKLANRNEEILRRQHVLDRVIIERQKLVLDLLDPQRKQVATELHDFRKDYLHVVRQVAWIPSF